MQISQKKHVNPVNSVILLIAAVLVSCGLKNGRQSDDESVGNKNGYTTENITVTAKQMQAVNIRLGEIEQRNLNSVIRVSGQMALDPQKRAEVNSLTGGIIRQILVTEGKQVAAGQVVAYLENTEIVEMQKNYLTTQRETIVAEQEYNRQKAMFEQGAGVEKSMQQATAAYEISNASLTGLSKQLQQLSIDPEQVLAGNIVTQIPIKAPISGAINRIHISTGSYVDIQTSLMSICDNTQIHCDLNVFEKDIHRVAVGQEVDLTLTNQTGATLKGVIYEINKSFEGDTKAIPVHVSLKNRGKTPLIAGMYVTALIHTGMQKTDAVPDDAIVSLDGKKYIFALIEEDDDDNKTEETCHFKPVEVVTGIKELGYTQITLLEELEKGTKIVISSAFYVASILGGGDDD